MPVDVNRLCQESGLPATQVRRLLNATCLRHVLQKGNSKLGRRLLSFGLPAVHTCPGATEACLGACYARRGRFHASATQLRRGRNLVVAHRQDFADVVLGDLEGRERPVVRIHDSGDFFSNRYARAWRRVALAAPRAKFFFYTRSWRVASIAEVLAELAELPNVRAWYSLDRDGGLPRHVPKRVRLAYMQLTEDDLPTRKVDLVFRDYALRPLPAKRVQGALVCPYENGTGLGHDSASNFDCGTCGLCWDVDNASRDPRRHFEASQFHKSGRLALAVV